MINLNNFLNCTNDTIDATFRTTKKPSAKFKGVKLEKVISGTFLAGDQLLTDWNKEDFSLQWGEWETYPFTIQHNGQQYVYLQPAQDGKHHTTYLVDGQPVSADKFKEYLTPGEAKKMGGSPKGMTVKVDSLVSIG